MNHCEHPQWEDTDLLFFGGRPGSSSASVVHRCRSCQVLFTLNGRVRSVKRREDCTLREDAQVSTRRDGAPNGRTYEREGEL